MLSASQKKKMKKKAAAERAAAALDAAGAGVSLRKACVLAHNRPLHIMLIWTYSQVPSAVKRRNSLSCNQMALLRNQEVPAVQRKRRRKKVIWPQDHNKL